MTVREFLDKQPACRVYCGRIGWASGFPRSTKGCTGAWGAWAH